MTETKHAAEWVRPRPKGTAVYQDAGLAILLGIGSLTTALLYQRTGVYQEVADPWVWVVGIALIALPLTLRRRHTVPVAILVSVGFFVCGQFGVPDLLFVQICLFVALYTVGAWEQNRTLAFWARLGITGAMLVWVTVDLIIAASDVDSLPWLGRTGIFSAYATFATIQIITNLIYFGAAFFFGERTWRAARTLALLEARSQELELERQTSATQAVAFDRLNIARELHDSVAHHVSVMGIQAAAARRTLESDPARATVAIESVEESARAAVTELHSLVHTLRDPESDDSSSSTVGVAQLAPLVAASQSAGTPTTLIVTGAPAPVPLLVDVALYRVAQESLTNVRKHAGVGASAEVRLRFATGAVEVEVSDDGVQQKLRSNGSSNGSGLGLRGMRERIGAVGGSLVTEQRERGGFLVRARVPVARVVETEVHA